MKTIVEFDSLKEFKDLVISKELVDILSEDKKELIDECTILQEELNNLKLSIKLIIKRWNSSPGLYCNDYGSFNEDEIKAYNTIVEVLNG
mgnify:FL=1